MKLKALVLCLALSVSASTPVLANEELSWNDYKDNIHKMVEAENLDEAIVSLKQHMDVFPEKEFELLDLTRLCYEQQGNIEQAVKLIAAGNEKGYIFWFLPRQGIYDDHRNQDWFRNAVNANNALRDTANKTTHPQYKVILPETVEKDKTYPLVILVHGGNQSIEKCAERWNAALLGQDRIIAYLQSSWIVATGSYRWNISGVDLFHQGTALDEITTLYHEIASAYPVDTGNVTICGFSQGATLAVKLALNQQIPCHRVIAGCPFNNEPTQEQAEHLLKQNVRMAIFTGDKDFAFTRTKKSCELLKNAGVAIAFTINKDKGHELPENFDDYLKTSMAFVHATKQ